jgi:membrane protein implicated in regulation of membrane protease activity
MIGSGKTLGIILMIGAGVLLIAFGAWATTALLSSDTTSGGAVLGILLALIVIAPVFGIGAYLFRKGGQEQREMAQVQ